MKDREKRLMYLAVRNQISAIDQQLRLVDEKDTDVVRRLLNAANQALAEIAAPPTDPAPE